jgi:hypothetical protein
MAYVLSPSMLAIRPNRAYAIESDREIVEEAKERVVTGIPHDPF